MFLKDFNKQISPVILTTLLTVIYINDVSIEYMSASLIINRSSSPHSVVISILFMLVLTYVHKYDDVLKLKYQEELNEDLRKIYISNS